MEARDIVIRPIITEKSYSMIEHNRYTFQVDKRARKTEIAKAVEQIFNVTVVSVNTMNVPGKSRRVRYAKGMTPAWKKAVVTLKEGDVIKEFGAS